MKKVTLSDIPKQEPFTAPDGYLEALPQRVQQRIQEQSPAGAASPLGRWWLQPRLQLAFASLVLLLMAGALYLRQPSEQAVTEDAYTLLEEVSDQELVNYLESSSRLSMQEIRAVADWPEDALLGPGLPDEQALEEEVLKTIDTYSADEIWK
ncbi:hypothetical protein [Cesiribacter andamanensis]|uniref:DUF3379 domain-containing protein n=1 Tax=Cesiribacter andamanensis AMV16 TaxID=1279009 RepID=M7NH47_9BACT|nr:hypothetical protein [Cesiribacter andamanensis]EMR01145.1 hypothetical protein ADICEAN_03729 [Cesiribacter andamanensis AMV16]